MKANSPNRQIEVFKLLSRRYPTPEKVQAFLKTLKYNSEKQGETVQSATTALKAKKAHCLEACLISAAILEHQGYTPLLLSLDSKDHLCHSLFIFKKKTGWGSIARSRCVGLHGREPRFRSVRDLAMSYFDPFVDKTGRIIGYTHLNLDESNTDWRFSKRNLWKLEQFIVTAKHTKVKSSNLRFKSLLNQYLEKGEPLTGKYWW